MVPVLDGCRVASPAVVDDAELVDRLRAGDEAAFVDARARYHAPLLRLAATFVGSRAVAEEVVQDTWLAVVHGVDRFEGRSSLKTWLFRIVVNRARTTASTRAPAAARARRRRRRALRRPARGATPPEPWTEHVDDRLVAGQPRAGQAVMPPCRTRSDRSCCCVTSRASARRRLRHAGHHRRRTSACCCTAGRSRMRAHSSGTGEGGAMPVPAPATIVCQKPSSS